MTLLELLIELEDLGVIALAKDGDGDLRLVGGLGQQLRMDQIIQRCGAALKQHKSYILRQVRRLPREVEKQLNQE